MPPRTAGLSSCLLRLSPALSHARPALARSDDGLRPRACASPTTRRFHRAATLCAQHDDDDGGGETHYTTLNLRPGASPNEVKKAFYSLSKLHHPDHNRADPSATTRFTRISEAYSVLGSAAKRAAYDRSLGLHLHHPHPAHSSLRRGSYHSTSPGGGPAGGRPASGLSRRRGPFRGPAAGPSRRPAPHGGAQQHEPGTMGGYGGMGPGQDPFGRAGRSPHFDKEGHERTHRGQDARREERKRMRMALEDELFYEPQVSSGAHFVVITAIIGFTILGPLMVHLYWDPTGRKRRDRELAPD